MIPEFSRERQPDRPLAAPDRRDRDRDGADALGLSASAARNQRRLAVGRAVAPADGDPALPAGRAAAFGGPEGEAAAESVGDLPGRPDDQHEHRRRGRRQVALGGRRRDARAGARARQEAGPRPRRQVLRVRFDRRGAEGGRPDGQDRAQGARHGGRGPRSSRSRSGRSRPGARPRGSSCSRISRRTSASTRWWPRGR